MPYKSKAQERLFFAKPELRKYAKEWAAETPSQSALPEHVKPLALKTKRKKKNVRS